jgi:hypothetical protein
MNRDYDLTRGSFCKWVGNNIGGRQVEGKTSCPIVPEILRAPPRTQSPEGLGHR